MDDFEWATLFLYLVAWWLPIIIGLYTTGMMMMSNSSSSSTGKTGRSNNTNSMAARYKGFKTYLPKLVPSWAFGPIWAVIYTTVALSAWMYLNFSDTKNGGTTHEIYYDSVNGLLLANFVLNMSWTAVFFGFSLYWTGTLVGLLIFLSALTIEILMWFHSGLSAVTITGAVLFIPYVIYSGYAVILALDVAINNNNSNNTDSGTSSRERKNPPQSIRSSVRWGTATRYRY